MRRKNILIPIIAFFIGLSNIYAQDWPQYLGPNRDSKSDQENIIRSWPENGPEVIWDKDIGIGYGGTVVRDGKVYLLDRDDEVGDRLRCFDLSNGDELWSFAYEAPGSVMFPGSRSVPTLDGNFIYTVGPYGDLYCIDINTQKPVWNTNIWTNYGGEEIPRWAITQCPLVYGDLLIVASQAPEAGVVAYDKLTGDVKWETASLGNTSYVSPSIVKVSGEDHVIMISAAPRREGAPGKVVGMSPLTGDLLWEYTNWQCAIPIANPVDVGDGKMLITGGYEAGSAMIQVAKNPEGNYDVTEHFKVDDFGTHTKPPVMYKDHFYAQYSTNERRDGLVCMNMEGEIKWKTGREPSFTRGSMILADGLLFVTNGETTVYLIDPDPNEFKAISKAELLQGASEDDPQASRFGTQNWAPIALADGKLIIRDQNQLKCVKIAN